ncbi:MAG: hypothetical protein IPJ61_01120 [Tessaracoccus sp.]|uniref:hypothetical protein n=1 Tax=Tessaracoccus sp. TaxID=1971211 RepID=UPI001ED429C9|nr:hypothetical protein [Tessaracoccus sp.]MBK7819696.1 hypothetical protein [Tessaracoccus sp.]
MSDEPVVDPTGDDPTTPENRPARRIVPKATTPDPEPEVESDAPPKKPEVTKARRTLWAVGLGVGGYMIIRGVYGILTGEEGSP